MWNNTRKVCGVSDMKKDKKKRLTIREWLKVKWISFKLWWKYDRKWFWKHLIKGWLMKDCPLGRDFLGNDLMLGDSCIVTYRSDNSMCYNEWVNSIASVRLAEGKPRVYFIDDVCHECYITLDPFNKPQKKYINVYKLFNVKTEEDKALFEKTLKQLRDINQVAYQLSRSTPEQIKNIGNADWLIKEFDIKTLEV